uniref:Uncharacterized protein n=1 Tax=Brassica oleracea var. oleracea TaxID=109376 RepID=A0A0D3E633_BRAOL
MPSSIRSSIKTALTLVEAILTHRKNNRVNWIPRHTGSTPPGFQRAPSDKKKKKKKKRKNNNHKLAPTTSSQFLNNLLWYFVKK